jgi:hypothetical protein
VTEIKPTTEESAVTDVTGEPEAALSPSTHFVFAHSVFRAPNAGFKLSTDGTPSFETRLGEFDVLVPLNMLAIEFEITEDSDDGQMLKRVIAGLPFIKRIRPGDSIPREILDGTASWSVEDYHRQLAQSRLAVQLASWMMGSETELGERGDLTQLADDPTTKMRVQEAATEMAVRLGLPRENKAAVFDRLELVARELAYIEALRDRFGLIRRIATSTEAVGKLYRRERGMVDDVARVQSLIRHPLRDLQSIFDQVDAQSGEILSLLRNVDAQIAFIRQSRDYLHVRMMLWDDTITAWTNSVIERSPEVEERIRALYRFLARHFTVHKTWELSNQSPRRA